MLNIGIIGVGGISAVHLSALKQRPDINIVSMADINEEKVRQIAGENNASAYTDYRQVLSSDIEAVFIFTPPFVHKEQVIEAAKAGKHVFCEKPLALTLEDADEILKVIRETKMRFMVGYVLHFHPIFAKMEELFKSGKLGRLVTCWTRRFMPACPRNSWRGRKELSGGITMELSTHDLEWLCSIGGRPESVYGRILSIQKELDCEDNMSATLTFKEGLGLSQTSWSSTLKFYTVGIIGTEGAVIRGSDGKLRMKLKGEEEKELSPKGTEPYKSQDDYFLECILDDRVPLPGPQEARLSLEVALAIQESSRVNKVVPLGAQI